jgi:prevent-host-death family protein
MKSAKISDLKARLSAYLADVRRGETVIVCDRAMPIARLAPLDEGENDFALDPPTVSKNQLRKIKPVRPRRPVDVVRLLRESRDQR